MTDKIIKEDISDLLMDYEPKSVEELAEWILMATRNLTDIDGKRIYFRLEGHVAYQIARMMCDAKLKVPE
jgi:hypothetical protein